MKNSRLLSIFNTFSKKEIRELKKWLLSPLHNQREDTLLLFNLIVKTLQNDKIEFLGKEKAFHSIWPKEDFDDARIRQTMHFLLKEVEEYLIFNELRSDEVRSLSALARVFRKRNLEKHFDHTIMQAQTANKKYPFRDDHFYRNNFLVELERYSMLESKKRTGEMNLQALSDALEVSFLSDKLKYSNVMLAHQTVYKTDYDRGMLDQVLDYIENRNYFHIPSIAIYYYGYKANSDREQPAHFQNLKELILIHEKSFPLYELRDIYLMAINYCISQLNAGKTEYLREAFEMYRNAFEKQVLIENKNLSRFTYMNVVSLGLKLGEFEWVGIFIENFKKYISPKYRDSIVHFSQANLSYEKKDYRSAMQLLTQVEFDDILMNLNAKRMLIKIFYEEGEFDALESMLDSLRTFLQRKKVMGYHKANITNLVKLTKRLLKINPFDKEQIAKLEKLILETNPLIATEREWLLEQLKSLN